MILMATFEIFNEMREVTVDLQRAQWTGELDQCRQAEDNIMDEERRDEQRQQAKNEEVLKLPKVRTVKNMAAVADRLQTIKSQLLQRQIEHDQRTAPIKTQAPKTLEQLMESKLLQMQKEQERNVHLNAKREIPRELPGLPSAEFNELVSRTNAFEQFVNRQHNSQQAEQRILDEVYAADKMSEQLKDQMIDLTTRGPNLCFDDRAALWQAIVATRNRSVQLRQDAETSLRTLEHTKLDNPYAPYSYLAVPETGSVATATLTCDVWLLGRRGIIESAEHNTDTVIYYGAYFQSDVSSRSKPLDGLRWLPCSDLAIEPAPIVQYKPATVESWSVSGAGLADVNGVYVLSGQFDGANKYTSVLGIELFRKRFSLDTQRFGDAGDMSVADEASNGQPIPTKFRENYNEQDFRVMQQIGSWLATQELKGQTRAETIKQSHRNNEQLTLHNTKNITIQSNCRPVMSSMGANADERHTMQSWQLGIEANLDLQILRAITVREELINRASSIATKAMSKYMANMQIETAKQVQKLVSILNGLRLATVHVIESIKAWRDHVQRKGHVSELQVSEEDETKFGWTVSITVTTGRMLYKGSNAFLSKIKRYCRDVDVCGQEESQVRYLGYFQTKVEAETAYDNAVVAEAKRMHTTVDSMPKKRYVFLSCGLHFAIESEEVTSHRQKKSACIECRSKALSKSEAWNPTYLWHGINYLLKIGSDLDFLVRVTPLQQHVGMSFPLIGNPFLVSKESVQDPDRFLTLSVPEISDEEFSILPNTEVMIHDNTLVTWTHPETQATYIANSNHIINTDASVLTSKRFEILDMSRLNRAKEVYLNEVQRTNIGENNASLVSPRLDKPGNAATQVESERHVQALYWDRCAALRINHKRPPLAFRQPNVWCRLDAGEWAGFRVRGRNLRQLLFHQQLHKSGVKTHSNRRELIQKIRAYMHLKWEDVRREEIEDCLTEAEVLRGDVVKLEAGYLRKFLAKFDTINDAVGLVQRWWRRVVGKWKFRARSAAMRALVRMRFEFQREVSQLAEAFVSNFVIKAQQTASNKIEKPSYSTILKLDGEHVVISWHSLLHASQEESILVRAYNPMTASIYRLKIGNERLRQLLRPRADGFLAKAIKLQTLPFDDILHYNPRHMSGRRRIVWEPIREAQITEMVAIGAEKQALFQEKVARSYMQKLSAWLVLQTNNLQVKKQAWLAFQKAKAQSHRAENAFLISQRQANEAVAFSTRASKTLSDEQPWDPLENANNWRLLVSNRSAELDAKEKEVQMEISRRLWFDAEMNEAASRAQTEQAKMRYETVSTAAKKARRHANEFRAMANAARLMLETSMHILSQLLALRFTSTCPTHRNLILLDTSQDYFLCKTLKLHASEARKKFNYNTLLVRCKRVRTEPIRGTRQRDQLWTIAIKVVVDSADREVGLLVTTYRPDDSVKHEIWIEARFVRLLMTKLRFRDPHAAIIRHHSSMGALRLIHGNASCKKYLENKEKAFAVMDLVKLNAFSGAITVGRVDFFRSRESLETKLFASHWWRDSLHGRKRGRGEEVYRQSTNVDGTLCHIVIYENWGDLCIQAYSPRTRCCFDCFVSLREIIIALKATPMKLQHWLLCVRTNRYSDIAFQPIVQHLVFLDTQLIFQAEKKPGRIVIREDQWEHLTVSVSGLHPQDQIHGSINIDPSGRRALFPNQFHSKCHELLASMVTIEPKHGVISTTKGHVLTKTLRNFNTWIETSKKWRNPLAKIELDDIQNWSCHIDSVSLREDFLSQWSPVLRRNITFEEKVGSVLLERDVVFETMDGKCMHTKLELCSKKGEFYLHLRLELFHEWEVRSQEMRRSQMEEEEKYTRQMLCLERQLNLKTKLMIWQKLVHSVQLHFSSMKFVCSSIQSHYFKKSIQLLANQLIMNMEVIEVVSSNDVLEHRLTIGQDIAWIKTFPLAPKSVILEPITKLHKVPVEKVLANMTKVAMFSRPIQVELFIMTTDDVNIWQFEVYGKALGLVVTCHADMSDFTRAFNTSIPPITTEDARSQAFLWLCGGNNDHSSKHEQLWSMCTQALNLPTRHLVFQSMTSLLPYFDPPSQLFVCGGLLPSVKPSGMVRQGSLDICLEAIQDGITRAISEVMSLSLEQVNEFHNELESSKEHVLMPLNPFVHLSDTSDTLHRHEIPRKSWHLLIPADPSLPIEEIYVQEPYDATLIGDLLKSAAVTHVSAFHGTLVVASLENSSRDSMTQRNTRASGLTYPSFINGSALYIGISVQLVERLLKLETSKCMPSEPTRKLKGRAWRLYANERLRAARDNKPNHSHLPLTKEETIPTKSFSKSWHPSDQVNTLFVKHISRKELEYILGIETLSALPELAIKRFQNSLELPALKWDSFDTSAVLSTSACIPVLGAEPVLMNIVICVNAIKTPTAIIVNAKDPKEQFGSLSHKLTIGWKPVHQKPLHGNEWAQFAIDTVPNLVWMFINGQMTLTTRECTQCPLVHTTFDKVRAPTLNNIYYMARQQNLFPADVESKEIGRARLKKHLVSSVQERMQSRYRSTQLSSGKSALEWQDMSTEDAASSENRGILTLPLKQLDKLQKAFREGMKFVNDGTNPSDQRKAVLAALGSSGLAIQGESAPTRRWEFRSFAEWWRRADIEQRRKEVPQPSIRTQPIN
ncbi:hypothetical protein AeMF1_017571 [Aphanomyces euteiches]|nr:hypothetical protein AeMF1_017571 [Aphanomyces euteiches]KAH9197495.1 hypothetical protein AeNC1_000550 [Aphanomyces euteiches]